MFRWRSLVAAVVISAALGPAGPAGATTATGWVILPGSGPTALTGVSATSSNDMWVAGEDSGFGFTQHWDGSAWGPGQYAPTTYSSSLAAITSISPSNVWAVGRQGLPSGTDGTLIQHWNGSTWTIVPSPDPDSSHVLTSVSGSSATNIWAVGQYGNSAGNGGTGSYDVLPLHYDGTGWSFVAGANPSIVFNELDGVSTLSASDAWAVGRASTGPSFETEPLAEHWNGTKWTAVTLPDTGGTLDAVKAFAANDVYVAGNDGTQGLLEHWDGTSWSVVRTPALPSTTNTFSAISGSSSNDFYVVGSQQGEGSFNLIEHWDGTAFTVQDAPNPDAPNYQTDRLSSVTSPSAGVAFTGGSTAGGSAVLELGTGTFTASLIFDASPASIDLGGATTLEGVLRFSQGASAWGATLTVDRTNPDGTHTALPDITADDLGGFSVPDTPPQRGTYLYTVTYPGTTTRSGTQAESQVEVNGTATMLTIRASATINYRAALTITAHLSAFGTNHVVSIFRHAAGGTRTLLVSEPVDATGRVSVTINPTTTTIFDAVYTGDSVFNPATSGKIKVAARVAIIGTQSGYYAKNGPYRLYHYFSSCVNRGVGCPKYTVHVIPNHAGEKVNFTLQVHTSSGWATIARAAIRLNSKSTASVFLHYTNTSIIGRQFREDATFPGDARNATKTTPWTYFIVTR